MAIGTKTLKSYNLTLDCIKFWANYLQPLDRQTSFTDFFHFGANSRNRPPNLTMTR